MRQTDIDTTQYCNVCRMTRKMIVMSDSVVCPICSTPHFFHNVVGTISPKGAKDEAKSR